jgi:hypothetical protein
VIFCLKLLGFQTKSNGESSQKDYQYVLATAAAAAAAAAIEDEYWRV